MTCKFVSCAKNTYLKQLESELVDEQVTDYVVFWEQGAPLAICIRSMATVATSNTRGRHRVWVEPRIMGGKVLGHPREKQPSTMQRRGCPRSEGCGGTPRLRGERVAGKLLDSILAERLESATGGMRHRVKKGRVWNTAAAVRIRRVANWRGNEGSRQGGIQKMMWNSWRLPRALGRPLNLEGQEVPRREPVGENIGLVGCTCKRSKGRPKRQSSTSSSVHRSFGVL